MTSKIEQGKELILNGEVDKGVCIFKDICLSKHLDYKQKYKSFVELLKVHNDEGVDMLNRLRDSIHFIKGVELTDHIKLLSKITRCTFIDSHQRTITAVTIYNHGFFDVCFQNFADLSQDHSILIDYRVEAIRYLFSSEHDEYLDLAQECLIEIINMLELPSDYRYKIIAGFISKTGIATKLNRAKIKIMYNEEFVYGLQNSFFYEKANHVRDRILSGQHLLDMEVITLSEKKEISESLLEICNNDEFCENVKADAADVVLRLGSPEEQLAARTFLNVIGTSDKTKKKTVYNDSQNVHNSDINSSVNDAIVKLVEDCDHTKLIPYGVAHDSVVRIINQRELSVEERKAAFGALNRINVDTATFTKLKVTIADVFSHIYTRICQRESDKEYLEGRLLDELYDMSQTCSSGHVSRLINVLSDEITISWEEQLRANVDGRVNAKIRDIDDDDIKASVAMGMMDNADEEDAIAYKSFITSVFIDLKSELKKEFVGEGYISEKVFNSFMTTIEKEWM